jgi:hypothetical protein
MECTTGTERFKTDRGGLAKLRLKSRRQCADETWSRPLPGTDPSLAPGVAVGAELPLRRAVASLS